MTLLEAIMNSQEIDEVEAKTIIREMADNVNEGSDPEEELEAYGLEPDYVMDLLEYCI